MKNTLTFPPIIASALQQQRHYEYLLGRLGGLGLRKSRIAEITAEAAEKAATTMFPTSYWLERAVNEELWKATR